MEDLEERTVFMNNPFMSSTTNPVNYEQDYQKLSAFKIKRAEEKKRKADEEKLRLAQQFPLIFKHEVKELKKRNPINRSMVRQASSAKANNSRFIDMVDENIVNNMKPKADLDTIKQPILSPIEGLSSEVSNDKSKYIDEPTNDIKDETEDCLVKDLQTIQSETSEIHDSNTNVSESVQDGPDEVQEILDFMLEEKELSENIHRRLSGRLSSETVKRLSLSSSSNRHSRSPDLVPRNSLGQPSTPADQQISHKTVDGHSTLASLKGKDPRSVVNDTASAVRGSTNAVNVHSDDVISEIEVLNALRLYISSMNLAESENSRNIERVAYQSEVDILDSLLNEPGESSQSTAKEDSIQNSPEVAVTVDTEYQIVEKSSADSVPPISNRNSLSSVMSMSSQRSSVSRAGVQYLMRDLFFELASEGMVEVVVQDRVLSSVKDVFLIQVQTRLTPNDTTKYGKLNAIILRSYEDLRYFNERLAAAVDTRGARQSVAKFPVDIDTPNSKFQEWLSSVFARQSIDSDDYCLELKKFITC